MTLSRGMGEYLRYHAQFKGGSRNSAEQYDRAFRMFLAYVQNAGLRDEPASFNAETVHGWAMAEFARGIGPRTVTTRLHMLGSLAKYLGRLKDGRGRPLLDSDPTKAFEKPKFKKPETKFLYPDELKRFLAVERPLNESLARDLLIDTMLRVSELCGANVADLEGPDGGGVYSLHVQVKGGARVGKPLSPEIAVALLDYLQRREVSRDPKKETPLLLNRMGQRWTRSQLTQTMTRIGQKAGIDRFLVSAHKLRHTSASVALATGANPLAVSKLLGHTSLRTTEHYLHLVPTALQEARAAQRAGLAAYIAAAR